MEVDVWQSFGQRKRKSVKREMRFVGELMILRGQGPDGKDGY